MNITSPAFGDGEAIPVRYSRLGGDEMPPLVFSEVPTDTKSLALVCHDPDAPRAEGWTHWVVWNIDPHVTEFPNSRALETCAQGVTDWGENHWGGPQPPSGTHRYVFYLYALDTLLDLPTNTTCQQLEVAMRGHILETATFTGLFSAV